MLICRNDLQASFQSAFAPAASPKFQTIFLGREELALIQSDLFELQREQNACQARGE